MKFTDVLFDVGYGIVILVLSVVILVGDRRTHLVESQAEARVAAETLLNTNLRADNLKLQHAFKECSLAEVFSPALEFQNDWEE